MSLDNAAYLYELAHARRLVRDAMSALREQLVETGFNDAHRIWDPDYPFQFSTYATGCVFFGRVWDELTKGLAALEELTEETLYGTSVSAQRTFDEVSLRQRKLFETFCLIAMLSRDPIYAPLNNGADPAKPGLYYLHFHLFEEREHLRLRNLDLIRYFGGECADTVRQSEGRQQIMDKLINAHHLDPGLCRWNWNERDKFENILKDCLAIERAAIGFGYQQIFGAASSQIHLNMAGLYDPTVNPREFFKRVDNLMLLIIGTVLRAIRIAVASGGQLDPACQALRDEFNGAFPNSYAGAAIGCADVDDIVSVFAAPDIFIGIVEKKQGGNGQITPGTANASNQAAGDLAKAIRDDQAAPTAATAAAVAAARARLSASAQASAEYVSYLVQPLSNVGRRGLFIDIETMVIIKAADLLTVLQDGVNARFITQGDVGRGKLYALSILIETAGAFASVIQPYMNKGALPYLYFVERYIQRRRDKERVRMRAYHLWTERGRNHGHDLRDWFEAERQA